jgi:hypothetical protein
MVLGVPNTNCRFRTPRRTQVSEHSYTCDQDYFTVTQSKTNKGKGAWGKVQRKPSFQEWSLGGVKRDTTVPPAMSFDDTCEMLSPGEVPLNI